ncbi:MAG TPA: ABC transporter ATP-binding protein [Actinomycetota bacterium]
MSDPVVSVDGLRKRYGDTIAVEDVSFEVRRGEIFGLLGPNGAGKTTTVECLQGLRAPDAGSLHVLGLDPTHQAAELRRRIGSQLQQSALPDRIKVREALHLFGSGADGTEAERLLLEWGLAEKRGARFQALSGGQRQRLFIALALLNQPEVVFLDEMTTGLDPGARRVAWQLISAIRERGTTVVLVTHFMDEAEHLCDRVAIVDRGRIGALGSPQELIVRHAGAVRVRFTAELPDASFLETIDGVTSVASRGSEFAVDGSGAVLARVAAALSSRGIEPEDLRVERSTLEEVFLALVGTSDGMGR